jgi:hypothetical protein
VDAVRRGNQREGNLGETVFLTPKAHLQNFYWRKNSPTFSVDDVSTPGSPRFHCTLTCPSILSGEKIFWAREFEANGTSSIAATCAASELALKALQRAGIVFPPEYALVVDASDQFDVFWL